MKTKFWINYKILPLFLSCSRYKNKKMCLFSATVRTTPLKVLWNRRPQHLKYFYILNVVCDEYKIDFCHVVGRTGTTLWSNYETLLSPETSLSCPSTPPLSFHVQEDYAWWMGKIKTLSADAFFSENSSILFI